MYQQRPRRFRRRVNGRSNLPRGNGGLQVHQRSNSYLDSQARNHFRTPQSAEKLFEKYNTLAKEALSSGDKTLSENYFQHADHFMRIIDDKNVNQNQNKVQSVDKPAASDKHLDTSGNVNQDKIIEEKVEKKE